MYAIKVINRKEPGRSTSHYSKCFPQIGAMARMSADSFLQAFRRFVSRKSLPKLIISDNATTFQSASTYLKTFFDSTSVRDTFANMGLTGSSYRNGPRGMEDGGKDLSVSPKQH